MAARMTTMTLRLFEPRRHSGHGDKATHNQPDVKDNHSDTANTETVRPTTNRKTNKTTATRRTRRQGEPEN